MFINAGNIVNITYGKFTRSGMKECYHLKIGAESYWRLIIIFIVIISSYYSSLVCITGLRKCTYWGLSHIYYYHAVRMTTVGLSNRVCPVVSLSLCLSTKNAY